MSPINSNHTGTIACVVDTECTYISKNPRMVFHFGATIGDIEQENSFRVIKMDYYVKEVMQNNEMFLHQNRDGHNYSYNVAMKNALHDAFDNFHKVRKWKDIIEEWQDYIHSMNVKYLTSYNFNFDIGTGDKVGTIRKTHQQLTDKTFYLPRGVDYFCLMDIAGTMFMNRNYKNFIESLDEHDIQQMRTDKGNPKYSAEACMRYLNKDVYFIEQHTALRDSLLEFRLLAHFWKKWKSTIKKDFSNNVRGVSLKNIKQGVPVSQRLNQRRGIKENKPIQKELALQGGKNG